MKNIEWKSVKNYEGLYEVSNQGTVRSIRNNIVLKTSGNRGYQRCILCNNGKQEIVSIHRLVYASFIGELNDSLVIDHIDGVKDNNRPENLQQIPTRQNTTKGKKRLSGYAGVHWYKQIQKWGVEIQIENVRYFLGVFTDKLKASQKYEQTLNNYLDFGRKPETKKEGFKVCRKCNRELPVSDFHTTKTRKGTISLVYQCKECEAKYKKQIKFQKHEKNINSVIGCPVF